jgi:hypothetical protein
MSKNITVAPLSLITVVNAFFVEALLAACFL